MKDNCINERTFYDLKNGDNIYFVDGTHIYIAEITDILQVDGGSTLKIKTDSGVIPLNIPKEAIIDGTLIAEYSDPRHAAYVVKDRINREIQMRTDTINILRKQLEEVEKLFTDGK